jgi:DNA gyrase subunit B
VVAIIKRLYRRYDADFLEQLLRVNVVDDTLKQQASLLDAWITQVTTLLNNRVSSAVFTAQLSYQNSEDFVITVTKRQHGVDKMFVLNAAFFTSKDYQHIAQHILDTTDLFSHESFIQMGERQHAVANFQHAFEWMMREVKKGQHIQRYKGLGEMNPEQLWETTLDANNRRLLQVRIEDAFAADEIFTTLMGDVVEPRRDFIVKNALDVNHLDV